MRTEHLDNKINELETLRSRGELTYMGGEMLSEFNEIKQALTLNGVSQQRQLLKAFAHECNNSTDTYVGLTRIEEVLKAFNCG